MEHILNKIGIRKHYGWIICLACLLLHACCCGMAASILSIFTPYWKAAYDLTNTQTSLIVTMRSLASMIFILTAHKYYRRFSLRAGACLACLILVCGSLLFAFAPHVIFCYIASGILGIAYAYGTMVPIALFMQAWFKDRRATALSIAACGSGVTTAVVPTIFTSLLESHGLRTTFLTEACIALCCAAVLFLLLKNAPADIGAVPYEDLSSDNSAGEKRKIKKETFRKGMKKKEKIFLMIAIFFVGCLGAPYLAHLTLHYRTAGYSAALAAGAYSVIGVMMVFGKFLFGLFSDRFGTRRVNCVFIGSWIAASLITASLNGTSVIMLYLSTFLSGIGISLVTVGITVWSSDFASEEEYANMVGTAQSANSLGALLWSPVPGMISDLAGGSFAPAYLVYACMAAVVFLITFTVYRHHLIPDDRHPEIRASV